MRIVDAVDEDDAAAIKVGQKVLETEIANPSMSVMIVRRDSPTVSGFVDRASVRCDPFPWRQGVWVRKDFIFPRGSLQQWFGSHEDACAVILNLQDKPVEWLTPGTAIFEIELAWLRAEGKA